MTINNKTSNEPVTTKPTNKPLKDIHGLLLPVLKSGLTYDEAEGLFYDLTFLLKNKHINLKEAYFLLKPIRNELQKIIAPDFISALVRDLYDGNVPFSGTEGSMGIVKLLQKHGYAIDEALRIKDAILDEILDDEEKGAIHCPLGDDEEALVSPNTKEILHVQIRKVNKRDQSKKKTVISAYPSSIIIYDSPLAGDPRRFKITFKTRAGKTFTEGPSLLSDITQSLIDSGYVISPMHVKSVLPGVVNHYHYEGLATVMDEIDYPGIFYKEQEKEVFSVGYTYLQPSKKKLLESVNLINELHSYFKLEEDKLSHCLKWGLIAPFSYIMKQLGNPVEWLYLNGAPGTGKTTMALILVYFYRTPNNENNLGGSSFDTVARIGKNLSGSTFPIIVNEPKAAFDKTAAVEMFKTSIHSTVARGKYEGRNYTNIPAFAPVCFTSNHFLPQDGALVRRMNILNYTHRERKTEVEKKVFEERFQVDNPSYSPLNKLQYIGYWFYNEIQHDPSLLNLKWKELVDTLLNRLYTDLELDVPEWLKTWCKTESLEDLDDDQREDIRIFILEEINKASKTVQWRDEEDRNVQQNLSNYNGDKEDFENRLRNIITNKLIPWMIIVNRNEKDYVCFTTGFKKVVHQHTEVCMALKSIGELLGWKHMIERLPSAKKVIRVSFEELVEFLYLE